jgi:putative flippase GtrA
MSMLTAETALARVRSRELLTFLAVGGTGYLVDVATFNHLRSTTVLAGVDPSCSRILAVAVAMVVTYAGNRLLTWRNSSSTNRRREAGLFVVFNVIGLVPSVLTLVVSHDLMGLTSRLADNVSANVVGVALGTVFRYWTYRRFVFAPVEPPPPDHRQDHLAPVA